MPAALLLVIPTLGRPCRFGEIYRGTKTIAWAFAVGPCTSLSFDINTGMDEEATPALIEALEPATGLVELHVADSNTYPPGFAVLGQELRRNKHLQVLHVRNSHMGYMGALAVAEALKANADSSVRLLHVFDNSVGEAGAVELARLARTNKKIKELHLSWSSMADKPSRLMDRRAHCQAESGLHCQDWREAGECLLNAVHMRTACAITCGFCRGFRNTTVPPGTTARELGEMLKVNEVITDLRIMSNSVGDAGAAAIAAGLKANRVLRSLAIFDRSIGDAGATAIAEALRTNSALKDLKLAGLSIGDEGALALAEALRTTRTMTSLDLEHNRISDVGAAALREAREAAVGRGHVPLSAVRLTGNPITMAKDEL